MKIEPIAVFRSPLGEKFGAPRQAGLVAELHGRIEFLPEYCSPEALRGLDGFDYLWLIWGFHLNASKPSDASQQRQPNGASLTVRPPRLGGNERMGVYATRSPFRPNPIGLSSVKLLDIDYDNLTLEVLGADLVDGTPIYDIKPYIPYTDSHPDAAAGFVDATPWNGLEVDFSDDLQARFLELADSSEPHLIDALKGVLAQDPRPQYHNDPEREYGLDFAGCNIRFKVNEGKLTITDIQK